MKTVKHYIVYRLTKNTFTIFAQDIDKPSRRDCLEPCIFHTEIDGIRVNLVESYMPEIYVMDNGGTNEEIYVYLLGNSGVCGQKYSHRNHSVLTTKQLFMVNRAIQMYNNKNGYDSSMKLTAKHFVEYYL